MESKTEKRATVKTETQKKRHKSFGRFLLRYAAGGLIVIAIGLAVFYMYMAAFECSRPENAMEPFMETADDAYWTGLIENSGAFDTTPFEDGAALRSRYYVQAVTGKGYTYRKSAGESTDEAPVYTVRAGTLDIARVSLAPEGNHSAGFGMERWQVEKVELIKDFLPAARTVTVKAPTDATVTLNGIAVGREYITQTLEYEGLTELEKAFTSTDKPARDVYTVDGIFDNIELTVTDGTGAELVPETADGTSYVYDIPEYEIYSAVITAPSDAQVFVNGAQLLDGYISAQLDNALLEGVYEFAEGLDPATVAHMTEYRLDGLRCKIESVNAVAASGAELICSTDAGAQLLGEYSFGFEPSPGLAERMEARVEDFAKAYIRFSANINKNTGGNWASVSQYLLRGSEAYSRLHQAISGLSWINCSSIRFDSIISDNYVEYGPSCFTCRLDFEATVNMPSGAEKSRGTYELVFVLSGSDWKIVRIEAA